MTVTRQQLQDEAISNLLEGHRLIVNWGTGVGKSRVAVESVRHLYHDGCKFLLLVNETAHKTNWKAEFIKALGGQGEDLFAALTVECYASLPKYEGTSWDLIVMDEAHHLRSEGRTALLATLSADYVLALSATLSEDGDGDALMTTLRSTFGEFRQMSFGVQDAIDNRILGEPKIYVHRLSLDRITDTQTVTFGWGRKQSRQVVDCDISDFEKYAAHTDKYPAMDLRMSCTARQGYDFLTEKIDFFRSRYNAARRSAGLAEGQPDNKATLPHYNRLVMFGNARKTLLGECKTRFSTWLLGHPSVRGKKYVCFCSSVDQGQKLGGDNIISSRRTDNGEVITSFNNGLIRSLFAVGMIQEGANLDGIEAGIIIQLGGKERVFVQKFGRALRAKCPEQHIIVMSNTRDEDYYRKAVTNINSKYIHEYDWAARTP